jgi:hypothetical protein
MNARKTAQSNVSLYTLWIHHQLTTQRPSEYLWSLLALLVLGRQSGRWMAGTSVVVQSEPGIIQRNTSIALLWTSLCDTIQIVLCRM